MHLLKFVSDLYEVLVTLHRVLFCRNKQIRNHILSFDCDMESLVTALEVVVEAKEILIVRARRKLPVTQLNHLAWEMQRQLN